jgi:hypothetical protein
MTLVIEEGTVQSVLSSREAESAKRMEKTAERDTYYQIRTIRIIKPRRAEIVTRKAEMGNA